MLSSIANYFSSSSTHPYQNKEFDTDKASVVAASLQQSRMEASAAKTVEALALDIQDVLIGDLMPLIKPLDASAPNVNESQHSRDTMKELHALIDMLSKCRQDAKLSTLPSADGIRVASVVTTAAHLVKARTEQRQLELLASLEQATRGRCKAAIVVDAESRRSTRLHTLQLCNLTFDSSAKNALRATLRNHQIVVLDLTNCFLGDDEVMSLLDSYLSSLTQLSVLSLAGNALSNKIVPYLISSSSVIIGNSNNNKKTAARHQNNDNDHNQDDDSNDHHHHGDTTTIVATSLMTMKNPARSNNNNSNNISMMSSGPAYLESSDKFLALRVLNLDGNQIAEHHLDNIKAKLALRWQRFVEKYDPNATITFHRSDNNNNNKNNNNNNLLLLPAPTTSRNFFNNDDDDQNTEKMRPTTTIMNFRNATEPSIFLSLDGNGLQGIVQAKYLAKNPGIALPHQATVECIVATSCSVITACALALGNISLENVCTAFRRLQEEVFSRTENDAVHYVESAGMYIRSWWYCGEYYSSAKAKIILDNLFGTAKFSDFPCSRVIVVLESSNGQVLYASSPTSSPLWNQCHTFLPNDPYCPTVSEICLAAMAAPGRFAPRKLYKSRAMTSSASVENRNNYFAGGAAVPGNNNNNLLQPPTEEIIVFDSCASIPNPAHIALIECMGPTTKPRRLISIATESEAQAANNIPPESIASLAASALSNWPNTRVVLSESEFNTRNGALAAAANNNNNQNQGFSVVGSFFAGHHHHQSTPSTSELRTREEAYTKLLANHSYIARAASDSVERALDSTLENEEALRNVILRQQQQQQQRKQKEEERETRKKITDDKNIDDNKNTTKNNNDQEQEMKSLPPSSTIEQDKKKHVAVIFSTRNHNADDDDEENNKNPIRTSSTNNNNKNKKINKKNLRKNSTTTAIYYERLFPLDARAPELRYDETSTRMLAVAILDHNVAGYEPQSSRNFNRYYRHYHYDNNNNQNNNQRQQEKEKDDENSANDENDTNNQNDVLEDDGFDDDQHQK